jgi:hypothetical protein
MTGLRKCRKRDYGNPPARRQIKTSAGMPFAVRIMTAPARGVADNLIENPLDK